MATNEQLVQSILEGVSRLQQAEREQTIAPEFKEIVSESLKRADEEVWNAVEAAEVRRIWKDIAQQYKKEVGQKP